jgi:hypothetical protein
MYLLYTGSAAVLEGTPRRSDQLARISAEKRTYGIHGVRKLGQSRRKQRNLCHTNAIIPKMSILLPRLTMHRISVPKLEKVVRT